jgi:salicylate hydroxylase
LEGFRLHINPAGSRALHACLPAEHWRRFVSTAGASANLGFLDEHLRELLIVHDDSTRLDMPDNERSYAADRVTLWRVLLEGLEDAAARRSPRASREALPY